MAREGARVGARKAMCGICSAGCWVDVTLDGEGRIARVEPDRDSPHGMICRIGEKSPEVVYNEDRLLHPMRRKGPKGTFEFERITWDEAFDAIVENLERVKRESGPEAAAIYTGSGSFELAFCDLFQPRGVAVSSAASVLFPYGSPNTLGVGALCYVSFAMIAPHVTMGGMYIDMFSDIENAEVIVVWGKNPAASCPPADFYRIQKAHARGARIIVIDPRRTAMADFRNAEWVPIRPGTDGALALGLCQVLIEEELFDETFVEEWTTGFDDFARYAQHYRPEVVESTTGVPADTVRRLAREIARADGAAPVMYRGLEYSDGGVYAIRAAMTFWALAGQLDVPGGHCFQMRGGRFPINREGLVANPAPEKAAGHGKFPVYSLYRGEFHATCLPEAVLKGRPYRIRSLISLGASLTTTWPQASVWRETLAGLDFFVSIDRQMNADCAWADIVLPACTYYEVESYMVFGPMFRIREKVVEPVGESRSDFLILAELARRLGYGHLYPQTSEEVLRHALKGSGFTLEEVREAGGTVQVPAPMMEYRKWEKGLLRGDGRPGFETPSRRFEIASSILEEHGYEALPVYVEPGESPSSRPDLARRFPLVFNSGAYTNADLHGLHLTVGSLRKERPVPTVMMNEEDARERGIVQGDEVRVETPRGAISMWAIVTDGIVRGAVEAAGAGGGPLGAESWQQANINDLTDWNRYDPVSGFPVYKALLCEVRKAEEGGSADVGEATEYRDDGSCAEGEEAPRIYLDHNATTPLDPEVRDAMKEVLGRHGNPSAIYADGRAASAALEEARRAVASLLGCTARRVTFTGGGSEANNLAIKGAAFAAIGGRDHLITSAVEHPSVLETCAWLEGRGFRVTRLPVDAEGRVSAASLEEAITDRTFLVSVMLANNETGVLQPVAELAGIARERGALFHTDAVQAVGKIAVDVEGLGVDLLTLSAHKLHGPKGVGALYSRKGVVLEPLVCGGHQEHGLRAGTENVLGIAGLGRAAELAMDRLGGMEEVRAMRDFLERGVRETMPGARVNGHPAERLPNTLNVTLPGFRGESVVIALDQQGVAASSGSACRAGMPDPSHALLAMGLSEEEAHCALRLSLGRHNTMEEVERTVELLGRILREQEAMVRFVSCR